MTDYDIPDVGFFIVKFFFLLIGTLFWIKIVSPEKSLIPIITSPVFWAMIIGIYVLAHLIPVPNVGQKGEGK